MFLISLTEMQHYPFYPFLSIYVFSKMSSFLLTSISKPQAEGLHSSTNTQCAVFLHSYTVTMATPNQIYSPVQFFSSPPFFLFIFDFITGLPCSLSVT